MSNPILETYKHKATNTVYDLADSDARASISAIKDGTNIDSFGDVETALGNIDLSNYIQKSSAQGLIKNDGTVDATSYATQASVTSALANKVDKVSGKGLSTNDYTTAEKELVATIENKADVTDLATAFSTSASYAVGNYVTYNGDLYRCTTAHSAAAWNASHFTAVTVGAELTTKQSNLGLYVDTDGYLCQAIN